MKRTIVPLKVSSSKPNLLYISESLDAKLFKRLEGLEQNKNTRPLWGATRNNVRITWRAHPQIWIVRILTEWTRRPSTSCHGKFYLSFWRLFFFVRSSQGGTSNGLLCTERMSANNHSSLALKRMENFLWCGTCFEQKSVTVSEAFPPATHISTEGLSVLLKAQF